MERTIRKMISFIEESDAYNDFDPIASKYLYTLFARCKKTYYAICLIRNNQSNDVNYVEALPLFRNLIESYFHLCYVLQEEDKEKVKEGYEQIAELARFLLAKKLKKASVIGDEGKEFLSNTNFNFRLANKYKFLNNVEDLSKKVKREDLYYKNYTVLNSFLHYNPATFINYGEFEHGKFIFNLKGDLEQSEIVFKRIDLLAMLFVGEVAANLNDDELESKVNGVFNEFKESSAFNNM
ncbi:DUF5677 domain-containing protein [Shouchella oshimensis]|nr:DUF5677 domain-containing protein [Shouchella oshimensis]